MSSKFKVGDTVRVLKATGPVNSGQVGIVVESRVEQYGITLVNFEGWNGGHAGFGICLSGQSEPKNNWFISDNLLELVDTHKTYILITEKNGKLAPATTPKTYSSYEQAEMVGKTMTEKHGGKFFIFKAVAELTAPPKPTVEVKKL